MAANRAFDTWDPNNKAGRDGRVMTRHNWMVTKAIYACLEYVRGLRSRPGGVTKVFHARKTTLRVHSIEHFVHHSGRSDHTRSPGELRDSLKMEPLLEWTPPDDERRFEQIEARETVGAALENIKITPREREVLRLRFWDEYKLREIGDMLGITESRVSQIVSGVLERLRRYLSKDQIKEFYGVDLSA